MKIEFTRLTKTESNKLSRKLREVQGNIKFSVEITGLNNDTLKRAASGMRIKTENAETIRTKLLV